MLPPHSFVLRADASSREGEDFNASHSRTNVEIDGLFVPASMKLTACTLMPAF